MFFNSCDGTFRKYFFHSAKRQNNFSIEVTFIDHIDKSTVPCSQTKLQFCFNTCMLHSKMPTVRNARSLVTSRELPSGIQIWGKDR